MYVGTDNKVLHLATNKVASPGVIRSTDGTVHSPV